MNKELKNKKAILVIVREKTGDPHSTLVMLAGFPVSIGHSELIEICKDRCHHWIGRSRYNPWPILFSFQAVSFAVHSFVITMILGFPFSHSKNLQFSLFLIHKCYIYKIHRDDRALVDRGGERKRLR